RGNLAEREVPPLSVSDFRLLLERRLGGLDSQLNVDALFRRMGGNALFLSVFADDLAASGRPLTLNPDQAPASLEAVFRLIYDRVRGRRDGQPVTAEGRQRARLLQLLCVAREPLGVEELGGLMAAWGEPLYQDECRDRVEEMSQWLLEAG